MMKLPIVPSWAVPFMPSWWETALPTELTPPTTRSVPRTPWEGTDGAETLYGRSLLDGFEISARGGDDVIGQTRIYAGEYASHYSIFSGGGGDDFYMLGDRGDTVVEAAGAGTDMVWIDEFRDEGRTNNLIPDPYIVPMNVEYGILDGDVYALHGNALDNVLFVSGTKDLFLDNGGVDIGDTYGDGYGAQLWGFGGDDLIGGSFTDDLIDGGDGTDTYRAIGTRADYRLTSYSNFVTINDLVAGRERTDALRHVEFVTFADLTLALGTDVDNRFEASRSVAEYWGGNGTDTVSYAALGPIELDLATGRGIAGGAAGHVLSGIEILEGSGEGDIIRGGEGRDVILAGGGFDVVRGGDGDDLLGGGAGGDTIFGGLGSDGIDGGAGGDRLRGDAGDDVLIGEDGADDLDGGAGRDLLLGGAEGDVLRGGDGDDLIGGGGGVDLIEGGAGNDGLDGGSGDDFLFGGAGDDRLVGDSGADVYVGGAGADVFRIDADGSVETIVDFAPGLDRLEMRGTALSTAALLGSAVTTDGGSTIFVLEDGAMVAVLGVTGASADWFA